MITLIAAIANNRCIGDHGRIPWHIPEDFIHFKRQTMGKVVLMGRKTWESLPPKFRPLPNRTNVIVTHQGSAYATPEGVEVYPSIADGLTAHPDDDLFVIGGAAIYEQTIDRADRLILTHVNRTVSGDAFFPVIHPESWHESAREDRDGFSFVTYLRPS